MSDLQHPCKNKCRSFVQKSIDKSDMRELTRHTNRWLTLGIMLATTWVFFTGVAHAQINKEIVLYTADSTGLLVTEDADDTINNDLDELIQGKVTQQRKAQVDEDLGGDDVIVLPELSEDTKSRSGNSAYRNIVNNISLGDFIVDERQMLQHARVVDAEFMDAPVIEVLRGLAEAADINYVLPKIETKLISIRLRMPAFKALELIASDAGMELVKEKDLWFVRKKDPKGLLAKIYKLRNIHLGKSGGGNSVGSDEDRTFGSAADSNLSNSSTNNNNTYNNNSSNQYGSGTSSSVNGTTSGSTGQQISQVNTSSNFTNLRDVGDRMRQGSDVLDTIRSILGIVQRYDLTAEGEIEEGKDINKNEGEGDEKKLDSFVSYNADSNSIYVIATENQHEWISKYLRTVDQAVNNIAIDAIFIESDLNPTEAMGVDWSNIASGYTFRAGATDGTGNLDFGTLDNPVLPTGIILNSDALQATVRAWITENKSRVARYPRVVTANNQQVKIETTTNIPVISQVSTTGTPVATTDTSTSGTTVATTDTTQTNYVASTQSIGTIINLIPQQINDEVVLLKIGIEISSADASTTGETQTGRVTTNATVYEGEVRVPTGKTLAIGGLERIAEQSAILRVPWLSEIPIFGFLFKDKSKDFRRTNITLLITPTILHDADTKSLLPSQFRDTRDERVMQDVDSVETQAVEKEATYRKR